jgi:transcriptional regulator with XRE-family HTH domain
MAMNRHLGEVARTARVRLGLTQVQVAQRIRLSPEVYGRIERGQMTPSLPALSRMCQVLELEPNALLGFNSTTPPVWLRSVAEHPRRRVALEELSRTVERLSRRQLRALSGLARALASVREGP